MMVQMNSLTAALILVVVAGTWRVSHGQQDPAVIDFAALPPADGPNGADNPVAMELLTNSMYSRFNNFSHFFGPDVEKHLKFCIRDANKEWDVAFNFSRNTLFLAECVRYDRNAMQRLCTTAELKFYGASLVDKTQSGLKSSYYLRPNKNCNLSSWPAGCEPGWSCNVPKDTKVNVKEDKVMPDRVLDCRPCCPGFFCPHGLTCMIPCPLGAYCPAAKLNEATGVCEPYRYQLPPGQTNHSCGGADIWSDFNDGYQVFCSRGYFCPTNTRKNPCTKGHFCRAGSTAQINCYQLASCKPLSENQNITAYGLVSFGIITLILIIIYNCSGQVLSDRERKQAESREAAAKSARETVQARERWRSAKDVAKKGAALTAQLSKTFSRRKSVSEPHKVSGQPKPGSDAALPEEAKGKKKKESNLTKMLRDLEENPDNDEGFNVEIGDKNMRKPLRTKDLHTRSQIFKYAYGQIEKEKAMQEQTQNMTFSGVISVASDLEFTSRPPIEVFFQDLTLTLKGKNKHLLRCVTGKLVPGHVSAVMGPSGAGKTTFLSALLGKAPGCTITGNILINGKNEPMQAYKRIIGYVPQDDIVHGNLTVEENLWFSARCRLPADLEKAEQVLVVERVIEALGLQHIRDSLVGTVEKRGISGGQRKRVNVGLEMVMEPSLLILDEPTSGLDSSSSLLLLRALRREALEGVNIAMVLHQPSYTLFRMFDDFVLLAKGGITVYHGPVKKVEEYFSGLGIVVPDRVNPPDYYIDILEGIVKPSASVTVKFKDLPLRWMLHNGYPVPPDMLSNTDEEVKPPPAAEDATDEATETASSVGDAPEQSFAGELWEDLKCWVEQQKDHLCLTFSGSTDLSGRVPPNWLVQYKLFLGRLGKQRLREARSQAVDYLILLLAGICLGTFAKVSDETFGSTGYLYTVIGVSLLSKIAALRSFSLDKLHYWRESSGGMSSLAYFLAKDTIDHFNTIIKPAVYLSMFYYFNNPRSTVIENYVVLLCLVYCVTGIAYVLAIYYDPAPAQLWSVLLPVVLTLVANQEGDTFASKLGDYCYTKWALEAFLLTNAERYSGVWLIQRCGAIRQRGYNLKHYYPCLIKMIATGIFSRGVAFFCLVTFQKK